MVVPIAGLSTEIITNLDRSIVEEYVQDDIRNPTGLAIAQEIVNAHGGNIFVQSNTEKTVFTVVLPQKQEKDKLSA